MIIGISLVALLFCIVVGAQTINEYTTLNTYKEQEEQLQAEKESEEQKKADLEDQEAYVKTDEYIEEMARKIGLLYPDEVIFKPEED